MFSYIGRHQAEIENSLLIALNPIHTGPVVSSSFISSAGSSCNLGISNPVMRVLWVCDTL